MTASPRPEHPRSIAIREIADSVVGLIGVTPPTSDPTSAQDARVTGVTLDSRGVLPGDLYAALPGARVHGGRFVTQAVASGAVALLTDDTGARLAREAGVDVPLLLAADPRAVLGDVAATIYGRPAQQLTMFGITGTNGKTTTAYLLEGALNALGERTGLIGTIETLVGSRRLPSVRTTPEASELHGLLALMRESGCTACCMEVSSHALALHRVDAVRYDVAIFTNLSQDHLDFHHTMENYFEAKADLFTPQRAARGVVCVDDDWGARLAREARIPVTTVAAASAGDRGADWTITSLEPLEPLEPAGPGRGGTSGRGVESPEFSRGARGGLPDPRSPGGMIRLRHTDGRDLTVRVGLPGSHNATNTALAVVALLELGYRAADVAGAFDRPARVPGRMQYVGLNTPDAHDTPDTPDTRETPDPMETPETPETSATPNTSGAPDTNHATGRTAPAAYVDFAHTPDAIAATLAALRHVAAGPLVAVLGAGGDRDPGKRPAMGAAAARGADVVVVTDDNPRHEDPDAIRASVAAGARAAIDDHRAGAHDIGAHDVGGHEVGGHDVGGHDVGEPNVGAHDVGDQRTNALGRPGPTAVHDVSGRAAGIALAVELAAGRAGRPAGVVAVLGKGHEQGQTIGDVTTPFDDAQVITAAWANLSAARPTATPRGPARR